MNILCSAYYLVLLFALSGLRSMTVCGQAVPSSHHFRSVKSGGWEINDTWETSPDGINNWTSAIAAPNSGANTISIRSGHSITIRNSTTVDELIIARGGILEVATGASSTLTVIDSEGNDILVQNGGIFKQTGTSLPSFSGSATLEIEDGGTLEAANNNVNASDYANTASTSIAPHVLWAGGSIFNWNNSVSPVSGVIYFPGSPAIPIFRVSQPLTIGGTSATVINGLLEANVDVSFRSNGTKTFRNGIIGTGKVGVTAVNGGQFMVTGTTAKLGGTGILELNNSGLLISSATTLTLTSDKTINNYSGGIGSVTNAGTWVLENFIVNGNTRVQIDGTVKTANINGLTGGVNTAFATASGLTIGLSATTSTVEYNRLGDQIVSLGANYYNLVILGTGTKTVASGSDIFVSGALNITSGNTFALNGTNNLKLNGGGTLNVNTNGVFDNSGESQVSGGGSPIINIYGTFLTRDAQGFTGTNASIPTIIPTLFPGCTVEYGRAGNQIVTARDDYKNLTFSGTGIKTIPTCSPFGTVTIKDDVIADASNKTFGDSTTNLTMTGGRFKVGGTGTKPDIAGVYTLKGGVIEFTNSGSTKETIRSPNTYLNIEVTGSNVANSKGVTTLADGGSFIVKTGGTFDNNSLRIDGTTGYQRFVLEPGATFITGVKGGFAGNDSAALKNIEMLVIDPKSTIVYNRAGDQTITPLTGAPTLLLKGSGNKTLTSGTLTIAASTDSVLIDPLVVVKVSPGAKVDFQGRPVIIRSDSTGSGMIGEITDGPTALLNATKVTVERFIPKRRSFRFLSPSVTTSTSIKANWMEDTVNADVYCTYNPHPGYGTNITGNNPTINGFDPTITNNPSLFTFNTIEQKWEAALNTASSLQAGQGYRLMVRGDRSIDMTRADNNPPATNTTLRTSGILFTGTYSPVLSIKDSNYTFIGNPFQSAVDFEKMMLTANNVRPSYYVWEPKLNVRGAYVSYNAVQHSNSDFRSEIDKNIQPGQAVFVQTIGNNSSPSIQFKESYKSTNNTSAFRTPSLKPKLSVQLLLNLDQGLQNFADGVLVVFDDKFSSAIGNEDSYKFTNLDENLAINCSGTALSIEGRPTVTANDTLRLKMWKFRQKSYYLRVTGSNFSPQVTAFLNDSYLHHQIPVDLSSVTLLPFIIDTASSASFAEDRFSIIFKAGITLPVTITSVNAHQQDKGIHVEWRAESEINIDRYEVERSFDGKNFENVAAITARDNNSITQNYSWFDANTSTGSNIYRIKVIEKSGTVKYTNVVKVNIAEGNSSITVFPNPVKGNVIGVEFNQLEKGIYNVVLYNNIGHKVYSGTINHNGRSATHAISIDKLLPQGIFTLQIRKGDTTVNEKVIVD